MVITARFTGCGICRTSAHQPRRGYRGLPRRLKRPAASTVLDLYPAPQYLSTYFGGTRTTIPSSAGRPKLPCPSTSPGTIPLSADGCGCSRPGCPAAHAALRASPGPPPPPPPAASREQHLQIHVPAQRYSVPVLRLTSDIHGRHGSAVNRSIRSSPHSESPRCSRRYA